MGSSAVAADIADRLCCEVKADKPLLMLFEWCGAWSVSLGLGDAGTDDGGDTEPSEYCSAYSSNRRAAVAPLAVMSASSAYRSMSPIKLVKCRMQVGLVALQALSRASSLMIASISCRTSRFSCQSCR